MSNVKVADGHHVVDVIVAFVEFRQTHDLTDAKISCCDRTRRLFETLERLEAHADELVSAELKRKEN